MPGVEILAAVRLVGQYRAASGPPAPGVVNMALEAAINFTTGTGAGQVADLMYEAAINIAASGSTNIDLNGATTDPFGNAIAMVKLKGIFVFADATNTNDIVIGNGTNGITTPFGALAHTVQVPPGGFFAIGHPGAGWTVTAATADILKLANSGAGTSVTGKVILIGTSA